jgi:dihydroorotate dehydrogenase
MTVANRLYHLANYFTVNVSSPNTPGLRKLQEKKPLTDIVRAVNDEMETHYEVRKPLFIKIAPDLTPEALDDVIEVVLENHLAGIIAATTTININIKAKSGLRRMNEPGRLSGDVEDYRRLSNAQIAHIWKETQGKIDIIGVGGVKDAHTALEKICRGARAVQIVTALRGEGPGVAERIKRGLVAFMEKARVHSIGEIVGQRIENSS